MKTYFPWMQKGGEKQVIPFHHSFKCRQSIISFTQAEVLEVLACRSYIDTITVIEKIKKRKGR